MGRFFYVLGYAIAAIIVGFIVLRRLLSGGPLRLENHPDDGANDADEADRKSS